MLASHCEAASLNLHQSEDIEFDGPAQWIQSNKADTPVLS